MTQLSDVRLSPARSVAPRRPGAHYRRSLQIRDREPRRPGARRRDDGVSQQGARRQLPCRGGDRLHIGPRARLLAERSLCVRRHQAFAPVAGNIRFPRDRPDRFAAQRNFDEDFRGAGRAFGSPRQGSNGRLRVSFQFHRASHVAVLGRGENAFDEARRDGLGLGFKVKRRRISALGDRLARRFGGGRNHFFAGARGLEHGAFFRHRRRHARGPGARSVGRAILVRHDDLAVRSADGGVQPLVARRRRSARGIGAVFPLVSRRRSRRARDAAGLSAGAAGDIAWPHGLVHQNSGAVRVETCRGVARSSLRRGVLAIRSGTDRSPRASDRPAARIARPFSARIGRQGGAGDGAGESGDGAVHRN